MRLVLTRLSALGDIVHAWPLATALAAAGHEVAWVVEEPLRELVDGHPAVRLVVTAATRRWRHRPFAPSSFAGIRASVGAIRAFRPDAAVDPQGLLKSAAWAALAGIPRRIGLDRAFRRERLAGLLYTEVVRPAPGTAHVVDLNLSLLTALGVTPPEGAAPDGGFMLAGPPPARPARDAPAVIVPGAGRADKVWPAARWSRLAARLSDRLPVVVAWGPGEERLARAIVADAGRRAVVAPPTSIRDFAGLAAGAAVVVGGDTGPVHLAASLGVPTVAVFVTTDPRRNGPRGRRVAVAPGAPPDVDAVERAVGAALEVFAVT